MSNQSVAQYTFPKGKFPGPWPMGHGWPTFQAPRSSPGRWGRGPCHVGHDGPPWPTVAHCLLPVVPRTVGSKVHSVAHCYQPGLGGRGPLRPPVGDCHQGGGYTPCGRYVRPLYAIIPTVTSRHVKRQGVVFCLTAKSPPWAYGPPLDPPTSQRPPSVTVRRCARLSCLAH